jgi:hypothetical protein
VLRPEVGVKGDVVRHNALDHRQNHPAGFGWREPGVAALRTLIYETTGDNLPGELVVDLAFLCLHASAYAFAEQE